MQQAHHDGHVTAHVHHGADDAFPIGDIDEILPGLLESRSRVYHTMGLHPEFDQRVIGWVNGLRAQAKQGLHTPQEFVALDHLYVMDYPNGTPRRLTQGAEGEFQPAWSPDGRSLAFTGKRSDKKAETTLHVIPVDLPGETRTIASMPDGCSEVAWSPDGRWIAFTSRTRDERYSVPGAAEGDDAAAELAALVRGHRGRALLARGHGHVQHPI